jgi:hypothetical protein
MMNTAFWDVISCRPFKFTNILTGHTTSIFRAEKQVASKLGLLLDHDDGGNIILRSVGYLQCTKQHHNTNDNILS